MKLICFLFPTLVPTNTAEALQETFFTSLIEALKATPTPNDMSRLPFAHDDTDFVVNLKQFMGENKYKPLSIIGNHNAAVHSPIGGAGVSF